MYPKGDSRWAREWFAYTLADILWERMRYEYQKRLEAAQACGDFYCI